MTKFSRLNVFSVACIIFLSLGCGGGGGSDLGGGGCGSLGAKVFNGESCNQSSRSPVVLIIALASDGTQISEAGICTGTLVTVNDLLTSAHCFVNPVQQLGSRIVGFAVSAGGPGGEIFQINNAEIHPFYNGAVGSPFDVAMATIDRVPNPAIGPVPILVSQLTEPGQRMSTFGYGTNNFGQAGELKSAELRIDALQVGGFGGNLLATLETSGASICQGDSGGPVVQIVNGVSSIVGVNSFGGSPNIEQCAASGASFSGFVDLQYDAIINFISGYAPDVAFN